MTDVIRFVALVISAIALVPAIGLIWRGWKA
jgi:hypothetical protein